jgi:hypothetical protein
MGDWFGKYKMGDNMFAPYFATLIGVDRSSLHEFMFWDQRQWEKVVDMAAEGTLHDWLTKKYGSEAGRLLDLVTEFAFSGRFGPLSGWGEHDVTLNFTDLEREREGGAMRLFKAKEWAGIRLEKEFGPKWDDMKNTEQGQKLIKTYARGYQGWIWVQTTLRSPTIVASEVRDPSNTYELRGEKMPRRLRNVVIEEVLNEGGKYKIEDKVKSEATPTPEKKALMARIELLERDVMLVQQAALYGNNGRPRNIEARDFEAIKGTGKVIVNRVVTQEVAQATRRKQAEEYVERVKNSVLGEWHEQQWREKLGIPIDVDEAHDKDDMLIINNLGKSKEILEEAQGKGALLSIELVDKKQPVHMGLEDVQWRYLDLETLGERSWARRGSDLEARATTIEAMIKHLDSLRPHPNLEEIGKSLEEIYNSEKMHDPNEAHKFVYLMSRGTGEMYRQVVWGKVPILGRIVSKIQPSSIAQQIYGVEYGTAWSANNLREFVSVVQQSAKLPYREVDPAGNRHAYNIKKLEKEFGATRFWAFLEMGLIGSALVTLLTAGLAVKESLEDEKKH